MLSGQEIAFVVEKLNEYLGLKLTVVEFDELPNDKLMRLLIEVLASLSPDMKMDITKDAPELIINRIRDFLIRIIMMKQLNNEDPNVLANGLMSGDHAIVHPIFYYIMQNYTIAKQRVYLARYLTKPKIPDEMFQFQDIQDLNALYQQTMLDFKAEHQQYSSVAQAISSPEAAKKEIAQKEKEKETIRIRNEEIKKKIEGMSGDSKKLMTAVSAFRLAQEQEAKLQESKKTQIQQLEKSTARLQEMQEKLVDTQKDISENNVDEMLNKLDQEVRMLRDSCFDQLPLRIDQANQKMHLMKTFAGQDMSKPQSELDQQIRTLKQAINDTSEKINKIKSEPKKIDKRMEMFKRQASIIVNKKNELEAKLQQTRKELDVLMQKKSEVDAELRQYDGMEVPSDEEIKTFKDRLFEKAAICKRMKTDLGILRSEIAVLRNTYGVLKSRHNDIEQALADLEKQKGIEGFRSFQNEIESVSIQKSEIDEKKGKTLGEISAIVKQINDKIQEKKNLLLPKKAEMKQVQTEFQEVEQDYIEKKSVYDGYKANFENDTAKIREDIEVLEQDISSQESMFHRLSHQVQINEVIDNRITNEIQYKAWSKENGGQRYSAEHQTFRDMLVGKVQSLESLGKELREKKRTLQDSLDANVKQIQMFSGLKRLLELKLILQKSEKQQDGYGLDSSMNEMVNDGFGVNRLVLGAS